MQVPSRSGPVRVQFDAASMCDRPSPLNLASPPGSSDCIRKLSLMYFGGTAGSLTASTYHQADRGHAMTMERYDVEGPGDARAESPVGLSQDHLISGRQSPVNFEPSEHQSW